MCHWSLLSAPDEPRCEKPVSLMACLSNGRAPKGLLQGTHDQRLRHAIFAHSQAPTQDPNSCGGCPTFPDSYGCFRMRDISVSDVFSSEEKGCFFLRVRPEHLQQLRFALTLTRWRRRSRADVLAVASCCAREPRGARPVFSLLRAAFKHPASFR